MPWIKVVDKAEATGELKEIYEIQGTTAGALANILKIHSLAPRTLSTHMAFYEAIMHSPGDDVGELRRVGFSDRAILEANLVTGYMSFVNRLAQGLGVELEDYFRQFRR